MAMPAQAHPAQRFLKAQAEPVRAWVVCTALLACGAAAIIIGNAWLLAGLVNDMAFQGLPLHAALPRLGLITALFALRGIVNALADYCGCRAGDAVRMNVRTHLLAQLLKPHSSYRAAQNNGGTGAAINGIIEGVEALQGYYAQALPGRMVAAIIPLALFAAVVPVDHVSAAILFLSAPLIPIFMLWIGKGADSLNQKQWRQMSFMSGHFLDRIQGIATLKLFNAAQREAALIGRICDTFREDTMRVLRIAFLSSMALEFFATVSIAMVAVMIGFRLLWGEMAFLPGFFVLLLAPEFYIPLRKMGLHYHAKLEALAAAEKLVELQGAAGFTHAPAVISKLVDFAPESIALTFADVGFRYGDKTVLANTSFAVQAGEMVALAGPSGAGKTTILRLALQLAAPCTGTVFVNDIDLATIDRAVWWQHVAYMPQRPHVFAGTVADNIRMANSTATDRQLADVMEICQIADFRNVRLRENGVGLSGGQIQRVALARALLRDAKLLIMDEPTAHLDAQTEQLVQHALATYCKERTVLYAAHRKASLAMARRVVLVPGNKHEGAAELAKGVRHAS